MLTRMPNLLLKTSWALALPLALLLPANAARASGYALTTIHSFDRYGVMEGGVTLDAAGNFYGASRVDGANGLGAVIRIDAVTGELSTVADFTSATGGGIRAPVTLDSRGNIYGITTHGGADGRAGVFKVDAATGTISTLASFNPTRSAELSALALDAAGNIYGSTGFIFDTETSNYGTLFKIDAVTGELATVVTFDSINGADPISTVTFDAQGNIYGATGNGGPYNSSGTVFKIDASTGELATLATFPRSDGPHAQNPWSGVVLDAAGNIYGTTAYGDTPFTSEGAVFKIDARTSELSILATFDGVQGVPSGLALDAAGNIYGSTPGGGAYGRGRLYRIDASTGVLSTIHSFNGDDGAAPFHGVALDAAGNIYGKTTSGGEYGYGTIFRLSLNGAPAAVPEPASLVMLGLGAGAGALFVRRGRR